MAKPRFNSIKQVQPLIDRYFEKQDKDDTPYTITGLAYDMGLCSIEQLAYYENKKHKSLSLIVKNDISSAIKRAKLKIITALELKILTSTTPAGAIFMGKARHKMIEEDRRLAHKVDIKVSHYQIAPAPVIELDSNGKVIGIQALEAPKQ